ncbi:MAG: GTP 3',8-cyclase MoaA [Chloroflexi bacterium]|nr:GTP 3',8-cyclase MoaA [Chloroflexota bacterium]
MDLPRIAEPGQRPTPTSGPLIDSFGRRLEDLRVSITDRCNFRCLYCMPEEGLPWIPNSGVMSTDEIVRVVGLLVKLGIKEVRLTGGEPTLRPGLPALIETLGALPGLESLSLTTNGFLLKQMAGDLAAAGLTRINVSLDTLVTEKFERITRRDALARVLEGLEEIEKYPAVHPIKVNAVAMRDFTEEEIISFAELARRKPYAVRFIEFMPLDAEGNWTNEQVLTGEEIRQVVHAWKPLVRIDNGDPSSTSRDYMFEDGIGQMGFINPVSEPFCSTCNRIRLTADGQLRTCLFSLEETSLLSSVRAGISDADLEQVIRGSVWRKELKHHINEGAYFVRPNRSMSQIGG